MNLLCQPLIDPLSICHPNFLYHNRETFLAIHQFLLDSKKGVWVGGVSARFVVSSRQLIFKIDYGRH